MTKDRIPRTDGRRAADAELRTIVEELRRALRSRIVIEQAKGVLAERFELSLEQAFALLRYTARSRRAELHVLARQVVSRHDNTPAEIVDALARRAQWQPNAPLYQPESTVVVDGQLEPSRVG